MLKTEYISLKKLKLLKNNPRKINQEDFSRLCKSIKDNPDYFEARPLICSDRTGELIIIAGNMRYKAAKEIGLNEVPAVILKGLTEEREKEIIIRDNVSNGVWDETILSSEFKTDDLSAWGVSAEELNAVNPDLNQPLLEESEPDKKNKIVIKIIVPPKVWLLQKDEIEKQLENISEEYGCEVDIP